MMVMTTVHIRWYGAYGLENFYNREIARYSGIYAIYRVYGEKETLLYIGKTSRPFWRRISEHQRDWLWNVKGKIKIRVGLLEFPNGGRYSVKKLADVESLLILWHLPRENTTSTGFYWGRVELEVINLGRRGLIDRKVSTNDLEWA
ncbi:GIY-YIG nuclease family protein [Bacillus infantis]|uniref:GIY-YIG nuclease family protein n=1 Tax=Bacillus infantis TaxID=324767 RepID=UPI003CE9A3A9